MPSSRRESVEVSFPDLADELRRVGRLLGRRGILIADDGNLSVRCPDWTVWITSSGVRKDRLARADLVRLALDGHPLEGEGRPSSESSLHLEIYRRNREVGAVLHAHPPFATGFAAAGVGLPDYVLSEAAVALGAVPVVPYAAPGSSHLGEAVAPHLDSHRAVLLANHGAVVTGRDLEDACRRMERLEHVACVMLTARLLGGVFPLTVEQRRELIKPAGEEEE